MKKWLAFVVIMFSTTVVLPASSYILDKVSDKMQGSFYTLCLSTDEGRTWTDQTIDLLTVKEETIAFGDREFKCKQIVSAEKDNMPYNILKLENGDIWAIAFTNVHDQYFISMYAKPVDGSSDEYSEVERFVCLRYPRGSR